MAAVRDLITGALRLIGAIDPGEALDGQSGQDALQVLNELIESLNLEHGLNPTGLRRIDATTTANQAVHTIGSGGNWDTARPIVIESAFVTVSGGEYEVEVISDSEYAEIPIKGMPGIPRKLFYDPEYPLGKAYLWPKPSAAFAMALWAWDSLPTYTTVGDTILLPPGYARMLRFNLACELAPDYAKAPSPYVLQEAVESKAALKRVNLSTPIMGVDEAFLQGNRLGGSRLGFMAGD